MANNTMPRDRSEQEVAGYRDALALIHESARDMRFSPNLILQLHSILYRFMPTPDGRWKASDNEIIERHQDGTVRVRFKATPAHLTAIAMEQLSTSYTAAIQVAHRDPLIVVPLAILDFLRIHPFTDGNGRVRRLLLSRTASFSISDIEAVCAGVSRDTVRLVLRLLKKEGMIGSTGKGRSAKWVSLSVTRKDQPHAIDC